MPSAECPICLEHHPISRMRFLSVCGHGFCMECIQGDSSSSNCGLCRVPKGRLPPIQIFATFTQPEVERAPEVEVNHEGYQALLLSLAEIRELKEEMNPLRERVSVMERDQAVLEEMKKENEELKKKLNEARQEAKVNEEALLKKQEEHVDLIKRSWAKDAEIEDLRTDVSAAVDTIELRNNEINAAKQAAENMQAKLLKVIESRENTFRIRDRECKQLARRVKDLEETEPEVKWMAFLVPDRSTYAQPTDVTPMDCRTPEGRVGSLPEEKEDKKEKERKRKSWGRKLMARMSIVA